ncbi:ribosome hibernation promoting factor [Legionella cardiaca]|uniref:Ribosome hibernation promoting factor n=1 Tax=Legionella cardiaca TaxID=1071983 RepID=A0ABY8AW85_9GAMM|nr:ribosome hibernation promoting factor [Legionella cardiaca]WED43422.1 ribosome hibernation promoting factor [Legionella cardiaca]
MQISFTGHNVEVTPALRAFTIEKFNKLERHFDRITSIHVVFDIEKLSQIAEASVQVAKGELHARAESEDMYAAIDALIDKLDRQLIKHKEKIREHRE